MVPMANSRTPYLILRPAKWPGVIMGNSFIIVRSEQERSADPPISCGKHIAKNIQDILARPIVPQEALSSQSDSTDSSRSIWQVVLLHCFEIRSPDRGNATAHFRIELIPLGSPAAHLSRCFCSKKLYTDCGT